MHIIKVAVESRQLGNANSKVVGISLGHQSVQFGTRFGYVNSFEHTKPCNGSSGVKNGEAVSKRRDLLWIAGSVVVTQLRSRMVRDSL